MNRAIVNFTGMIDRALFFIGIFLSLIFTVLKFWGKIGWDWKWVLSPLWIYLILTFLRMNFIVRPSLKKEQDKENL